MKSVISAMQFLLSIDKQPNALALKATNIKQVTTWRTIQKILNASAFQQLFGLIQKKWPCYVKQAYNCTSKYYLTFSEAQRSIGKISIPTNSFKNIFGAHDAANSIVVFTC